MESFKYSMKLISFAVISLVIVLPACKTISQVQFQVLEAPKVVIPSDINRFAFVYRNQHFPSDSVAQYYSINKVSMKDSIDHTQNMPQNCYQGFVENLSEFWTQDSIPFISLPKKMMPDTARHFTPLRWNIVDSLCKASQTDILIVLEDIQAFNKHDIVEEDVYWASTEIHYYGKWRIYDPLYQKIYDDRLVVDSLFLETSDINLVRFLGGKLFSREQILNDASYVLGRGYVDLISPKWMDVRRNYFVSGDKRLSTAPYFINKNEFDTAIKMWESLTGMGDNISKEKDLKLAGRAAYNLAVVYEMKGDIKKARSWVRKAIYLYKKMKNRPSEYKEIEAYSLALDSRWLNSEKIKLFFGEDPKAQ
ncbi:tetratricopeptide repeat protein [Ancylomarina salipaludis]|uniref:Tetratricopeptide repeat protein n=1 Tax=Ancylomarina salipaludis TaxID=2501299 RepID=A0A4Q1JL67_9BACT|nr:DUF6340 family protein [Ancylomarina salipaludis]RXQ94436.1 tetratricopeptide repeat protein [Ancylomarina salipaludis]